MWITSEEITSYFSEYFPYITRGGVRPYTIAIARPVPFTLVIARADAQSNCWQNFDCNRPHIIHRNALNSTLLTIRLRVKPAVT